MSSSSNLPKWTELPPGADVLEPGSAANYKTGLWRSERPVWRHEQCVKCAVCVIFCPEGCIDLRADGAPEGDLEYCKGCGICARECFTGCITMVMEQE